MIAEDRERERDPHAPATPLSKAESRRVGDAREDSEPGCVGQCVCCREEPESSTIGLRPARLARVYCIHRRLGSLYDV